MGDKAMKLVALKTILASALLCGCSSLRTVPTKYSVSTITKPTDCNGATGYDKSICDALEFVQKRANKYGNAANEEGLTDSFFGYQQVLSAISLAGFSLFDAHPDNIRAATLSGAVGNIGQSQLKPASRAKVFVDANRTLNCVHLAGRQFLGANDLTPNITSAVNQLFQWRTTTAGFAVLAPDQAAQTNEALNRLQAQITATRETQSARSSASGKISDTLQNTESTVSRLLEARAPDIASLVAAITELGQAEDTNTAPVDAASLAAADAAAQQTRTYAENGLRIIAGSADALTENLANSTGRPGTAELERIASCVSSFE